MFDLNKMKFDYVFCNLWFPYFLGGLESKRKAKIAISPENQTYKIQNYSKFDFWKTTVYSLVMEHYDIYYLELKSC